MKPSLSLAIAVTWNIILNRHISHVCQGLAFTSSPQPHLPPARASLPRDDAAIISSKTSPFESSALSWLNDGRNAPPKPPPGPRLLSTQLLAAAESMTTTTTSDATDDPPWTDRIVSRSTKYKKDKVKRVIDSSTIQLERGGYVSLDVVRGAGGTYQLPDCMDRSPSYKLKQLLPKGTEVRLVGLDDVAKNGQSSSGTPKAWIVRDKDNMIINRELVRSGFAFVRKGSKSPPAVMNRLIQLERAAREEGLGIFKSCAADGMMIDNDVDSILTSDFVAEFEPLDHTTEIRCGDDGGKSVVVSRQDVPSEPPSNPGDVKGCSDFNTYEDALGWYEKYAPYYGDVAELDRDGDGVPCPGLPHTAVAERYRMKVPTSSNSMR